MMFRVAALYDNRQVSGSQFIRPGSALTCSFQSILHYLVTALVFQFALDTIIGVILFYRTGLIDSGPLRTPKR